VTDSEITWFRWACNFCSAPVTKWGPAGSEPVEPTGACPGCYGRCGFKLKGD